MNDRKQDGTATPRLTRMLMRTAGFLFKHTAKLLVAFYEVCLVEPKHRYEHREGGEE